MFRRVRPRQVLCLTVCFLLILLCLFRGLANIEPRGQSPEPRGHNLETRDLAKMDAIKSASQLKQSPPPRTVQSQQNQIKRPENSSRVHIPKHEVLSYMNETDKIPRVIHLTWKTRHVPTWTRDYVVKWRLVNPLWQVWFWSDEAAEKLIKTKYPESYDVYKGYHSNIQRADAMRYFILYEYGGFYADLDIEPIRSLETLRAQHACVLSTEPNAHARFCFQEQDVLSLLGYRVACNAVMACRRHHPFFKYVIDMLPMVRKDKNPLGSTGPMMLTYRYLAYQYFVTNVIARSPHRVLEKQTAVFLAPDVWFMPSYDAMQADRLKKECRRTDLKPHEKEVCDLIGSKDYVNGPRDQSLTNHHWVHTWIKGAAKHKDPSTYDVTSVIGDVIFPDEVLQF